MLISSCTTFCRSLLFSFNSLSFSSLKLRVVMCSYKTSTFNFSRFCTCTLSIFIFIYTCSQIPFQLVVLQVWEVLELKIQFAQLTSMLLLEECNLHSSLKKERSVLEESSQIWEACIVVPWVSSLTLVGQTTNRVDNLWIISNSKWLQCLQV